MVITLDCDWAPDFVIKYVAGILTERKVKATWFITNDFPFLDELKKNPLYEIGIHPNFAQKSTQGQNPDSILTNLKSLVPESKSLRTHSLIQSSLLLPKFQKYGIENDVSLLLPKTKNIEPHYIKHINLFRFPYFWEDDFELQENSNCWSINDPSYHVTGLKIFNFHPIYVYLNSYDMKSYNLIKQNIGLGNLNEKIIQDYVDKNHLGAGTFFEDLINSLKSNNTYTIQDLQNIFKQKLKLTSCKNQ